MCTERDQFNDKYQAKNWRLAAAINSMPQGLIMLDGKAAVVAMNANKSGLFSGDVAKYVAAVLDRIAKREMSPRLPTLARK
ncbi:hypothetical protein ACVIIW_006439 [Bradyrhizobium sp. USDA 4449]